MPNESVALKAAPSRNARTQRLLEGPILPTMLRLAGPNVLVMATLTGIGLIELYFVAQLGVDVLAGVSYVFPLLALLTAISQGSVGGAVVSVIARAIGAGRVQDASELAWYAIAIAVAFGLGTTLIVLTFGPSYYAAMGANGPVLDAAVTYSTIVFGGATLIWIFNLLLAVVRGTGNLALPVKIVCGGAILLVPLSPALIFGVGGLPGLGVAGGAIALLLYYGVGSIAFAWFVWGEGSGLELSRRPPKFELGRALQIVRLGGMSALVSSSTNLTIAIMTGLVATQGLAAVAGYGAGARLEILLVPISYGTAGPAAILISTNLGAGQVQRALRTAWVGVLTAGIVGELIGLTAAFWPSVWLSAFTSDAAAIEAGSAYLQTVGPFFGMFAVGYALYCAGQGVGRMGWPIAAALLRAVAAIGGGLLALHMGAGANGLFTAVSVGMLVFGLCSLPSLLRQEGYRSPLEPAPAQ